MLVTTEDHSAVGEAETDIGSKDVAVDLDGRGDMHCRRKDELSPAWVDDGRWKERATEREDSEEDRRREGCMTGCMGQDSAHRPSWDPRWASRPRLKYLDAATE